MQKFKVLLFQSLKLKIKKKSFYASTIIIFLAIILLINIPGFLIRNHEMQSTIPAAIYSENQQLTDEYLQLYEPQSVNLLSKYEFTSEKLTPEEFNQSNYNIYIQLDDNILYTKAPQIPVSDSYLLSSLSTSIEQQQLLIKYNVDPNYLIESSQIEVMKIIDVDAIEENTLDDNSIKILASSFNVFFLIPIFILIIFVTQTIGLEIADEKTSRGMEIIISNVSSKVHMLSKVISGIIYTFIQIATFFISAFVGIKIFNMLGGFSNSSAGVENAPINIGEIFSMIPNLQGYIIYIVLFLFLAIALYSILIAILASGVTSSEDIQKFATPVMLVLVAGFYYTMFTAAFTGLDNINFIIGMIPLYNIMMAPMLYLTGTVGNLYMIISIVISIITTVLVFNLSQNKYKRGLLNYSSEKRNKLFSKK